MRLRVCLAALFLAAGSAGASAACFGPGTPMFTCSFNGGQKQVNVCLQANVVLYSFGPTGGAPELLMGRDVIGVEMSPWNGVGRSIWEEITLYSGVFSYNLSYALDRNPDGDVPSGRLVVGRGDSEVAELICDAGSVDIHDFYPLFEAKEASGQRYCPSTFSWGSGC